MEPRSPALQADSLPAEPQGKPTGEREVKEMNIKGKKGKERRVKERERKE